MNFSNIPLSQFAAGNIYPATNTNPFDIVPYTLNGNPNNFFVPANRVRPGDKFLFSFGGYVTLGTPTMGQAFALELFYKNGALPEVAVQFGQIDMSAVAGGFVCSLGTTLGLDGSLYNPVFPTNGLAYEGSFVVGTSTAPLPITSPLVNESGGTSFTVDTAPLDLSLPLSFRLQGSFAEAAANNVVSFLWADCLHLQPYNGRGASV